MDAALGAMILNRMDAGLRCVHMLLSIHQLPAPIGPLVTLLIVASKS